MLYEDGAKMSEVGIKDGSSVHLAIYSTDQVCRWYNVDGMLLIFVRMRLSE